MQIEAPGWCITAAHRLHPLAHPCYIPTLLHCCIATLLSDAHCKFVCVPLLHCYLPMLHKTSLLHAIAILLYFIAYLLLNATSINYMHFSRPLTLGYCNYAALLGELSLITWCCICLFLNICMIQNVWQCFMWHLPSYKVGWEMQPVQSVTWWPVTLARCILQKLLLVCLSLHRLLPYMWHPTSYMRHCAHCILPYM